MFSFCAPITLFKNTLKADDVIISWFYLCVCISPLEATMWMNAQFWQETSEFHISVELHSSEFVQAKVQVFALWDLCIKIFVLHWAQQYLDDHEKLKPNTVQQDPLDKEVETLWVLLIYSGRVETHSTQKLNTHFPTGWHNWVNIKSHVWSSPSYITGRLLFLVSVSLLVFSLSSGTEGHVFAGVLSSS